MRKKRLLPPPKGIRFKPEDLKLIEALMQKKSGTLTSVVREAVRVLAAKEEVVCT